MWKCPNCKRSIRNTNQWHSCKSIPYADHLKEKSATIKSLFNKLHTISKSFGPIEIQSVKSAILFKSSSTFLEVKFRKDHLRIGFYLDEEVNDFPVIRTLRISKNRVGHVVLISRLSDIDKQLTQWLKHSYQIVSK